MNILVFVYIGNEHLWDEVMFTNSANMIGSDAVSVPTFIVDDGVAGGSGVVGTVEGLIFAVGTVVPDAVINVEGKVD